LTTAIKTSLSHSAALALALVAACGGNGNTGRSPTGDDIVSQIPWTNGAIPLLDTSNPDPMMTQIITSGVPVYPAIGQNLPDPGSLPVDCSTAAPYEFAPWVATQEPEAVAAEAGGSAADFLGIAMRWAGADDYTRGSWRTPGFTTWYPDLVKGGKLNGSIWGTPAQAVDQTPGGFAPSCDGVPNNNVIHMRGAGFRYYGGNVAHILAGDNYPGPDPDDTSRIYFNDCPKNADGSNSDLCHPEWKAGDATDYVGFPPQATKHITTRMPWDLQALHSFWDVSKYEGVSFWARRGPDSFGTLLITINNKFTSDDMNRQNETFCRRVYACRSQCQNYEPCSLVPGAITNNGGNLYRCYDPKKGALPPPSGDTSAASDLLDAAYPRCDPPEFHGKPGGSACTFRDTYPDPDFEGKACRPYSFPTGGESAEYCYDENDPPPPSREERCGDGFTSMVQLTGDWKFYTIPFSDMRQGGYGKRAPYFDLKSVYSVTLGWGPGNVDFYIDNVSLYRTKKL
jgi:hypothetical protein